MAAIKEIAAATIKLIAMGKVSNRLLSIVMIRYCDQHRGWKFG